MGNLLTAVRRHFSPGVAGDGVEGNLNISRDSALFTAGWEEKLVFEGRVFSISVGTIASKITGGGAGLLPDLNQPEFGVSVPSGTTLIPLAVDIACSVDLDADLAVGEIWLIADTTAAWAADGTSTAETPANLLDGADGAVATSATAFSAATADITNPVVDQIIAAEIIGQSQVTAASVTSIGLNLHWRSNGLPRMISGPGAFYGYWGGTKAAIGVASVVWAEVPSSRFN